MLPFTDRAERRTSYDTEYWPNAKSTSESALALPPHPRSQEPTRRSSFSFASRTPRLFHREDRSRQSKEACKQDLNSCAFFAKLNGVTSSIDRQEQPEAVPSSPTANSAAAQSSCLTPRPEAIDDPIWTECKTTIDSLEATLNDTFKPNDTTTFMFGDDLRAAGKAFHDAKATIRRASKRLSYHWDREHQLHKTGPMLEAQILLGQRIRKAWAEAMERKEALLDRMEEEQVQLGSEEMDVLLDGLDPEWFERNEEDVDCV